MQWYLRSLFGFSVGVSLAGACWSQEGMRGPVTFAVNGTLASPHQSQQRLQKFADCVVKARPDLARALIALMPDSPESLTAERKLLNATADKPICKIEGTLKITLESMRGSVANALYRRSFKEPLDPSMLRKTDAVLPTSNAPDFAILIKFTRCVTRDDPVGVDNLTRSEVASSDETDAIQSLAPAMRKCAQSEGSLSVSPWKLRAFLSEAIYQASIAATPS